MRPPHVFLLLVLPVMYAADPQAPDLRKTMEASIAQQRQAAASMAASLAAQKTSLAKQTGQSVSESSFFVLPPPGVKPNLPSVSPTAYDCDPLSQADLETFVTDAARRENLPPELIRTVAKIESGFRPCAVSPKGAMGIMQLMPATATQLGIRDPFDPQENIRGGAHILKQLLGMYDLPMALAAYNAGAARVNATGGIPNIPETIDYIQKALSLLNIGH